MVSMRSIERSYQFWKVSKAKFPQSEGFGIA